MIDLRSDTVTRPTPEMRDAARDADVGDDVHGEDPTVDALEERAAEILGTAAALYVPSGTMGNQVAVLTHTNPGQEVIVEAESHLYNWECGGLATNAGVQPRPLDGGADGLYTADQLATAFIEESLHQAGTGLVTVENTHNHAGGVAHAPAHISELADLAHDRDLPIHVDGARLWNAAQALGEPVAALVDPVDSVMVALSKGLGAPVGSIVAGSETFVAEARRQRKRLGGGMRQAGIIAAPALVALENRDHLAADHARATRLASGLADIDGLSVQKPETNIVLVTLAADAMAVDEFVATIEDHGVRAIPFGGRTVRMCTHRDVDDADIEIAIDAVDEVLVS